MRRFNEISSVLSHPAGCSIEALVSVGGGYATVGSDQLLRCWDGAGKLLASKKAGSGGMHRIKALAARPSGDAVLTGAQKLTFYDAATAKPVGKCKGHGASSDVTKLAFLADGRFASAGRVNQVNKANGVKLWDAAGEPLASYLLESALRKAPCEAHDLARAPSSDTLFALAYSRISGSDSVGPGWYVHRIAPADGTVTRIIDLSGPSDPLLSVTVESLAVSDAHVAVSLLTSVRAEGEPFPNESFAELRVYDRDGALAAQVATERRPPAETRAFGRLAASADGSCLALGSGLELRSLPDLEVLDRRADEYANHLVFDGDTLLYAGLSDVKRVTLARA